MPDYVICVRRVKNKKFDAEPSPPDEAYYLTVSSMTKDIRAPAKEDTAAHKKAWTKAVIEEAKTESSYAGKIEGDILLFVHGFNTPSKTMLERHRKIKKHLKTAGYKGTVVSFCWPCDSRAINYMEDRWDAKKSALKLVEHGIKRFLDYQSKNCEINIHVLAHSMGSYVVREAFDDADDVARIASVSWSVSQVMLVSGDISSSSLGNRKSKSSSLYRHCNRLTNYYNPYDGALKLSNVKRVGVAPRVGRIGMPEDIPRKAVDVNCGLYYDKKYDAGSGNGMKESHTWYFDDELFFKDVYLTIQGDIDRERIPTRGRLRNGGYYFRKPPS